MSEFFLNNPLFQKLVFGKSPNPKPERPVSPTPESPSSDLLNYDLYSEKRNSLLSSSEKTKILYKANTLGLYDLEWTKKEFNKTYFDHRPKQLKELPTNLQIRALENISLHMLQERIGQADDPKLQRQLKKQKNRLLACHAETQSFISDQVGRVKTRSKPLSIVKRQEVPNELKPILAQIAKASRRNPDLPPLQQFRSKTLVRIAQHAQKIAENTSNPAQLKKV
ncbi:hypothetical protein ACFL1M_03595 [Patescibacteria group bacterium]